MNPRKLYALLLAGALVATACSQSTGQSAPTSTAPTSPAATAQPAAATAAAPTAAAAPTQAVAPQAPPPAATATQAPVSSAATPAARPAADSVTLRLVPADGEARFVAREQLVRNTIQSDAVGRTKDVNGQIVVGPNGQVQPGSKVTVNVSTLQSDSNLRDGYIKRSTLQTDRFPEAEFVPSSVEGLPSPLPTSGDASFTLAGDLTVHGVTKPVTWDVNATFGGQDARGTATTVVQLPMFDMPVPHVPAVASIEDNIRLELDFHVTRSFG